jgi:multiple sugar transport system permease protein
MIAGKPESALGRTPYYVLTGGLAIIFLFPLVWSFYASVSPQAGTAQSEGFGWGNYQTMFDFGAGLPTVAANSAVISILTVAITLIISTLAATPSPASSSGARTRCSC